MIRRLREPDRAAAVALLNREPALNLYFLGNIAALGFDADFCEFWGDWDDAGQLRAVLNRYRTGWVVYGLPDADWWGLGQVVDSHPVTAARLQDNPGGVPSFLPYLTRYRAVKISEEELMELHPADFCPVEPPAGVLVRRAVWSDLPSLVDFYSNAAQMTRTPEAVADPLKHRRIWLAERDGQVLSAALTNAETDALAMVGGVFTRPEARGQGLSQATVSALCMELIADKLRPVLYWETPAAGAVYRKLGFRRVGIWRSVHLGLMGDH